MFFLNVFYFNVIFVCVHVVYSANLSKSTFAVTDDHTSPIKRAGNKVLNVKIYEDSDVHSNVAELGTFLENSLRGKILEYKLNPLTKLGDNWASVLQSLDVKFIQRNDSNQVESLHLVCKTINSQDNSDESLTQFSKEIHFYSDIVPAIKHFEEIENIPQIERINGFPRYYGSRFSLNSSATKPDTDAALFLENLKFSNYTTKDRRGSLDRDEVMATLKILAKIHALGISMRRKRPQIFNSKILPYLQTFPRKNLANFFNIVIDELNYVFRNYSKEVLTAIGKQYEPGVAYLQKMHPANHTPFTTICNRDLWIANVMINKNNTEINSEIQIKLLDFQSYGYESFAHDLIYFLLKCASCDDLRTHFKLFIEYYHSQFIKTLTHVDFPLDDYTYDKIWGEVKEQAKCHLLRALRTIKFQSAIYDGSISKHGSELKKYLIEHPASDIILSRWKCIIDLYIENEFI